MTFGAKTVRRYRRTEIARLHPHQFIWLDAGNHHASGQLVIGNHNDPDLIRRSIKTGRYQYLPTIELLFPDLLKPEPPTLTPAPTGGCMVAVEQGGQSLFINDFVAATGAEYLRKLLYNEPIHSFMTFIGTEGLLTTRSVEITSENLLAYLQG